MRLLRALFILALTLCGVSLIAPSAEACACAAQSPPPGLTAEALAAWERDDRRREVTADFETALAVFSGEVIALDVERIRFKLDRVWKGELAPEFDMDTGQRRNPNGSISFTSCDFFFKPGTKYIVFAYGKSIATMKTAGCTPTGDLSRAGQTIEILDALVKERAKAGLRSRSSLRNAASEGWWVTRGSNPGHPD